MGTGSFRGVKSGRGVLLTTHPLLVPQSWKSRAIPLSTLWATPGLQRDHFTLARILAQIRGILVKVRVYVTTRILYTFSHFVCHRSRHHYVKWNVILPFYPFNYLGDSRENSYLASTPAAKAFYKFLFDWPIIKGSLHEDQ